LQVPCFVEASVVDDEMEELIIRSRESKVFVAPSCTLLFHPAIKKIQEILESNTLGVISNVSYISGQYLPDWHVYESPSEYYVSNPITGGAREIVPFELTWITKLFGFPTYVAGINIKSIDIKGAEKIDDTYSLLMDYNGFIFSLNVDVVSRCATRRLLINGSKMQLIWDWDENNIKIFDPIELKWKILKYDIIEAESGYNKNITEQMYNEEIGTFLGHIKFNNGYPNSLEEDLNVLKLLYSAEESYKEKKFVRL
jgi:predicted dehydrogenase